MIKPAHALLCLTLTVPAHAAEEGVFWKWDRDGATKMLFAEERCRSYYSLAFPVKVTPAARRHFTVDGASAQIVSLPKKNFITQGDADPMDDATVLRKHKTFEILHMKARLIERKRKLEEKKKEEQWHAAKKILVWVTEVSNEHGQEPIVTASSVSGDCVVYASALVPQVNKGKMTKRLVEIMSSLQRHQPTSRIEAENLIGSFSDD